MPSGTCVGDGSSADRQRKSRPADGIYVRELRDDAGLRQHVATAMSRLPSVLDGLLVDLLLGG